METDTEGGTGAQLLYPTAETMWKMYNEDKPAFDRQMNRALRNQKYGEELLASDIKIPIFDRYLLEPVALHGYENGLFDPDALGAAHLVDPTLATNMSTAQIAEQATYNPNKDSSKSYIAVADCQWVEVGPLEPTSQAGLLRQEMEPRPFTSAFLLDD